MKIRPVEAELFHTKGQTERQADRHDEANSRFSQFYEKRLIKGTSVVTSTSHSHDLSL
jgi:hypothetical protein